MTSTALLSQESLDQLLAHPIFFERNRVFRVYQGGKLFSRFFGDPPEDGNLPEEWVASSTRALNRIPKGEFEGVSLIEGTGIPFSRFLADHADSLLGGLTSFDLLVKLLDSAIRLPVQAHPDKDFSRKAFHSSHGKTEMWLVLETRENACIYYGFKDGITREEFQEAILASETDRSAMPRLLNRLPAHPGDVYLIPAKMVHAIGEGCLILEVQEPTDFTVQPEAWCGDYRLNDHEMYLGLDHELALECFDFTEYTGAKAIDRGRKFPRLWINTPAVRAEALIAYADTPDFAVNRYTISQGAFTLPQAPAIFVATAGTGEVVKGDYRRSLKKGDYFFLPAGALGSQVASHFSLELIECLPPGAVDVLTEA